MEWINYFCGFCAGMFLANAVPHFTNGISGNRFPTPFAKPMGKGLSSPVLNVVWGLANMLIGFLLYRFARISLHDSCTMIVFFAGIALISILSGIRFAGKQKI